MLQKVELKVKRVVHVGTCDNSAGNYPLAKKKMTMEVWQKYPDILCIASCMRHVAMFLCGKMPRGVPAPLCKPCAALHSVLRGLMTAQKKT